MCYQCRYGWSNGENVYIDGLGLDHMWHEQDRKQSTMADVLYAHLSRQQQYEEWTACNKTMC